MNYKTVALCGNPNSGKSSIFNQLSGLNQKVTNIPGTTIDRKEAWLTVSEQRIKLLDTPGTYSILPKSIDEEVALEILQPNHKDQPDVIVYVADTTNLKRNLLFFSQLAELKIPMILVLNMLDVSTRKGIDVDLDRLEKELGIRVLETNARKGKGLDLLKTELVKDQFVPHYNFEDPSESEKLVGTYHRIDALLKRVMQVKDKKTLFTERYDPILTHPIFGYLIFSFVLLLIFQTVFKLGEYPTQWIESGFHALGNGLINIMEPSWFRSLLVNGIIAGLAGVIVFIPQIAILFFFMAILEDTGYMARVSFIMDKVLRGLGLSGKSVVPLLTGAGCAIPGIMAARNIENWKDRMITILVTPLMSCSARLFVYTLLVSMAVPDTYVFGIISQRALLLLAIYMAGTLASLISALAFKFILKQRDNSYFIMELPIYHLPRWKNIWLSVLQKSKSFVIEAGKVILIVSILLWFLASYGPSPSADFSFVPHNTTELEKSYAGHFGKVIEPAIRPLGFNWKIGIALLTSFAAREVFVGTMSTIYNVEDEENLELIRTKMQNDVDPTTGKPVYGVPVILSLMVFYAFAMQCFSTLAVVYKETGKLKWPVIQFVYMTGLAYVASLVVFQVLS